MGGNLAGTMGKVTGISAGVSLAATGGDWVGTMGEASGVSTGVSSVVTEDDLMVLAAHVVTCAHIRLRNPPPFF
jgi:hypothetical protein